MNESNLADLVATLGILVLSRTDAVCGFRMEGTPPLWFVRLFPEGAQSRVVDANERFPFLESFLPTAENFWASSAHGRIRSGEWTEELAGKEVPLQASAVVLDGAPLLLIEHVRSDYERIKGVLQKARERKLESDTAEQMEQTVGVERLRRAALLAAIPGAAYRIRADGAILEGVKPGAPSDAPPHVRDALPAELAEVLLDAGGRALAAGKAGSFQLPDGRVGWASPIGASEFWVVLGPAAAGA